MMITERLDTRTDRGRSVAVWRSVGDEAQPAAPIVVLSPGFARRMRDVGAIALFFTANGAVVYRFDAIDHIGLSDGDMRDFTLTGMFDSLRAVVDLARSVEGTRSIRLASLSLSALAAYRLAARDPDVDRVLSISGVVDGRATIERATGQDYATVAFADLPGQISVEGHEIDPRPLWTDHRDTACLSFDLTVEHLENISAPVVNCIATDDPWVHADECTAGYQAGSGGERIILRLPYSGHDLGRNPVAMAAVLEEMTKMAVGPRPLHSSHSQAVRTPPFEELLDLRIEEREREATERDLNLSTAGEVA